MSKILLTLGIFTIALLACLKPGSNRGTSVVDMIFTQTSTPTMVNTGQDIVSAVKCYGSDLCYKFLRFEVFETTPKIFEIRAKATYPNGKVFCAQALYEVDSVIRIKTNSPGQYQLRFYNRQELFKTDTVQAN